MTRGNRTYEYQGKYAIVGGQNLNSERISVRAHVRLPDSEVDPRTGEVLPPRPYQVRNPRTQRQNPVREPARVAPKPAVKPAAAQPRQKGIALRRALAMASVLTLVLLGSSLIHYSQLTSQSKRISALRNEIVQVRKETADKRVELADIACDTDVWYSASQKLGMISSKGVAAIYLTAEAPQIVSVDPSQADVPPARTGIYAALLGFLD